MAQDFYFAKFPNTIYNDFTCRDISRRVGLSNEIRNLPTLFYPYEIQAGQRPDLVAYAYYDDPYLEWLIFLTNGILDPYYDWYLDENDFQDFLIKKYGSIEESQRRIHYYSVSWADDETNISVDFFNNALSEAIKKYYTPVFGQGARIISYTRRREDWIVNTNKVINFNINLHSNVVFSNNELVNTKQGANNVGRAEVIFANSTLVSVQHVSGNTSANNTLVGLTSTANATILDTDLLDDVIPDEEFVFWEGVTKFEWERMKNESKKQIFLLEKNWALEASEQLRKRLKE